MMKKFFLLCATLCGAFSPLSALPSKEGEGARSLEQLTQQLSLKLLLEEKERSFENAALPLCRDRLCGEMRKNPQLTAKKKNSFPAMQQWFDAEYQRAFAAEAEKLFAAYPGVLSEAERKNYLDSRKGKNQLRSRQIFAPLYEGARQELAAEQREKLIFSAIYPSVEEVEKYDDRALAQRVFARFEANAKMPVMEENLPLLERKVVSPVVAAARQQQKLQLELLARLTVAGHLWKKSEIETQLGSDLEAALALKLGKGAMRYPLFPATKKALQSRAAAIPVERIAFAMENQLVPAHYEALLETDTASHRTPEMSWKKCDELYFEKMRQTAVKKCNVPAEIRIDDNALKQAFQRSLAKIFQPVRERFAVAQLKKCTPSVSAWKPQMTETETFAADGRKKLPKLSAAPKVPGTMTLECEFSLQNALMAALTKEADRMDQQMKAVSTFYSEVAAECAADQRKRQEAEQSFWLRLFGRKSGELTLPEIVKVYSERIEKEASSPLFPSVEKEIDIRSRAILQQLREPVPEKKEKQERIELIFRLSAAGNGLLLQCGSQKWDFRDGVLPSAEIKKFLAQCSAGKDVQIKLFVGDTVYYRTVAELRTLLKECAEKATVEDSFQR